MVTSTILLTLLSCCAAGIGTGGGTISGAVVNATQDQKPVADAEVVLRIESNGQFVPLAETRTDWQGRFQFSGLLVGEHIQYLPGANRQGVHYPGPRLRLTSAQPHGGVQLAVCDVLGEPNPLLIRRQEIVIEPEPGLLRVTERLLIENPSSSCYIGRAAPGSSDNPVTLRLGIPANFEKVTFEKEFFGRQFTLRGDALVTSVPWQPGQREVAFTYVLRNQEKHHVWQRPLDLPCSLVEVRVHTDKPAEVECGLKSLGTQTKGRHSIVHYATAAGTLPAGHVIRVELGKLPIPWFAYGRWVALAVLAGVGLTVVYDRIRRRRRTETADPIASSDRPAAARFASARRQRSLATSRRRRPGRRAA